ncbi:hypothetical protein EXN66_Car019775 [Channa argus]|uniref:Uncharacterized protein n=1 Tax=Channa argus TaxID=215402 RepID=A0A6G1QNN7_CHAAH|nr:hypothetical protein EXN66_Car019775 [Channa argus]
MCVCVCASCVRRVGGRGGGQSASGGIDMMMGSRQVLFGILQLKDVSTRPRSLSFSVAPVPPPLLSSPFPPRRAGHAQSLPPHRLYWLQVGVDSGCSEVYYQDKFVPFLTLHKTKRH